MNPFKAIPSVVVVREPGGGSISNDILETKALGQILPGDQITVTGSGAVATVATDSVAALNVAIEDLTPSHAKVAVVGRANEKAYLVGETVYYVAPYPGTRLLMRAVANGSAGANMGSGGATTAGQLAVTATAGAVRLHAVTDFVANQPAIFEVAR